MYLLTRLLAAGGILSNESKAELQLGLSFLRDGLHVLSFQPEGSFEFEIVKSSKQSLADPEQFVDVISKP